MKSVVSYLNCDGDCREVMEIYQRSLGAELDVQRMGDAGSRAPSEVA